ncbi:FeoA domain-containing protein [Acidithiobacillus sp.]|uniref:FeoA domain-containing protein n=1 Tax=Acidithiobacillus sp. TaxID=1872118 RepID=UPI0025C365A9|nr:FeoA domain-containing protein [Acidithiobacillus sp.]
MTQISPSLVTLGRATQGSPVEICAIQTSPQERRRLLGLGLRLGSVAHICQGPNAQGVVLQIGSVRIALGRPWLEVIAVRQRPCPAAPTLAEKRV